MNKELKGKLMRVLIVPIGLIVALIPFSLIIGWNLITLILFWFVLIPILSIYLPTIISNKKNHLFASAIGLLSFYAFMVFMIYDHYKTDYFQVMIFSGVINLIIVSVISNARKLSPPPLRNTT